jgi:predicted nucleotidyltransferase component of viral defense system
MISVERLEKIAAETSFQAATVERVVRVIDVLERINRDPFLGPRVALKGGTALNVFYLSLDRLSVDIDLNYVGSPDRAETLKDKPGAEQAITALMKRLGYTAQRVPDQDHAGGKWVFRYQSAYGQRGTLEIDTNYLYRIPFFGTRQMDSAELGGYRAGNIKVVDLNEIAAGKLVALVARRASRDLYDTWRLLDRSDLDWNKVKVGTLAIGAASRDLDWRTASLDAYVTDYQELQSKLISVLRGDALAGHGDARQWAQSIIGMCRERLAPLFVLDERERAFLDGIYEEGRIDASLLHVDDDIRRRIEAFPALRWKAQNVAEFRRKSAKGDASGQA